MTRMSAFLRAAMVAALLALGAVMSGPVTAQDATAPADEAAGQVEEATDEDDDGFDDWGLLGLLGLAGLAGLVRRPQPVVHESERSGFTGATDRVDNRGL